MLRCIAKKKKKKKLEFKKYTLAIKSKYIILWDFFFFLQKWQHSKYNVNLFT